MMGDTNSNNFIPLSICIPTFNRAASLKRTIEILLPQCSNFNIQIVISNNCSNDATDEICQKISEKYNYVDYICQETNIGFSKNLAAAIMLARGNYIWMLGDDDIPMNNSIEKIIDVLNYEAGWIVGNFSKVDEIKRDEKIIFNPLINNSPINLNECLSELGIWSSFMSTSIISSSAKDHINSIPSNDYFGFSLALLAGSTKGCLIMKDVIVSRKVTPFKNHRFKKPEIYIFDFFSYLDELVLEKKFLEKLDLNWQMKFHLPFLEFI
ncbi:MAG: glycosyltransferase family 2 protein [Gammaproteobacteria bacterium]